MQTTIHSVSEERWTRLRAFAHLEAALCSITSDTGLLPAPQSTGGSMAGKSVIRKSSAGYRFLLKARVGEIITTSEIYESKASAQNEIASVQKNAPTATVEAETGE